MTYYIILAILILGQIALTPVFITVQRPGRCFKSLCIKILCSSMFLLAGIVSAAHAGEITEYKKYMLCGLALGFLGDILLHVKSNIFNGLGFLSFLSGHIFYILAFNRVREQGRKFLTGGEIAAVCAIMAAFVLVGIIFKIDLKIAVIPCLIYGAVITVMTVKCFVFGCNLFAAGGIQEKVYSAMLICGSTLFIISDASIAPLIFDDKFKHNYPLKKFNLWTYYMGQLLIALSLNISSV